MHRTALLLVLLSTCLFALASDEHCPAYPVSERATDTARLKLEHNAHALSGSADKTPRPYAIDVPVNNFIDDQILGTMAVAGIYNAPLTNDAEFLRRISLDLAGRIPTPEEVVT